MKIDFHVHVTPPDIMKNWQKIAQKEEYFRLLSESSVNKFASVENIVKQLETSKIDKAVIFGFAFKDMGLCRYVNDYVAAAVKKYPDKLIGFMSVVPTSQELEAEMNRCIDMGLSGVGELFPDGQGFDITSVRDMTNISNICTERDIPLMIHTNEPVGHYYCGKMDSTPAKSDSFVGNFPDLTVVLAHWGGGLFFYELMPEIRKKNKNVYYDIAASPFLFNKNIYKVAKEIGILDKVLFGSDYPLLPMGKYIKEMEDSGLSPAEQALIQGKNAQRLLKL